MAPVVILDRHDLSTQPGVPVQLTVKVKNPGRRVASYDLEVVGVPDEWTAISPAQVRPVERNGEAATAVITITPPMGPAAPLGQVHFGLKAVSSVDGSSAVDEGVLSVGSVGGLEMTPTRTQRTARWRAKFPIELRNTGNDEIRLALTAHDPADQTALTFDRDVIALASQASTTATLTAKLRAPTLRGAPAVHQLNVAIHDHPRGADMPRPGFQPTPGADPLHRSAILTVSQQPVFSRGVTAILGLVVVAIAALLAYRLVVFSPAEPEVAATRAGPDVAFEALAGAISFSWEPVSGARTYRVGYQTATGAAGEELSSGTTSHVFSELEVGVEHTVTLTPVADGDGAATVFRATPTEPTLSTPTDLRAELVDAATGEYQVSWTHESDVEASIEILVDGQVQGPFVGVTSAPLVLEPGTRSLAVRAVTDDGLVSGLSPLMPIDVPPPPTAETGGSDGTGNGATEGEAEGDGEEPAEQGQVVGAGRGSAAGDLVPTWSAIVDTALPLTSGGVEGATGQQLVDSYSAVLAGIPSAQGLTVVPFQATQFSFRFGDATPTEEASGWLIVVLANDEEAARGICSNTEIGEILDSYQGDPGAFASRCQPVLVEPAS